MAAETKNLLIAILLSFFVVFGWSIWESQKKNKNSENFTNVETVQQKITEDNVNKNKTKSIILNSAVKAQDIEIETNKFDLVWTNNGGVLKSIIFKDDNNENKNVSLMLSKNGETAFNLKFGDYQDEDINALFAHKLEKLDNGYLLSFYTDFYDTEFQKFKLIKSFKVLENEYIIEAKIKIESYSNIIPTITNKNLAYTLSLIPQIGPDFDKLDKGKGSYEFRNFIFFDGKKKKELHKENTTVINKRIDLSAIVNRYFAFIETHSKENIKRVILDKNQNDGNIKNEIYLERTALTKLSSDGDVYKFYFGPRIKKALVKYSASDKNDFGYSKLHFETVAGSGSGPISFLIKFLMDILHDNLNIKNWGLVIIILTIIIKVILIPFTLASSKQTSRMQELQPKIKEIQTKFKDNPQKMNMEMAKFYKEYKVNPAKGCLPVILQMFILIPLFNVLRTDYALRGEPFMLWITDLSLPDTLWSFDASIPVISSIFQNSIRILPALFVLTQILSTKFMQGPDQAGNKQMKIMMYALPLIFFFTLYNMPSGLFVYWIIMNILSTIQQIIINSVMKRKKMAAMADGPTITTNKIVPKNKIK